MKGKLWKVCVLAAEESAISVGRLGRRIRIPIAGNAENFLCLTVVRLKIQIEILPRPVDEAYGRPALARTELVKLRSVQRLLPKVFSAKAPVGARIDHCEAPYGSVGHADAMLDVVFAHI